MSSDTWELSTSKENVREVEAASAKTSESEYTLCMDRAQQKMEFVNLFAHTSGRKGQDGAAEDLQPPPCSPQG
eukprot:1139335-Pelagomonas_calceolata.AAC.6